MGGQNVCKGNCQMCQDVKTILLLTITCNCFVFKVLFAPTSTAMVVTAGASPRPRATGARLCCSEAEE